MAIFHQLSFLHWYVHLTKLDSEHQPQALNHPASVRPPVRNRTNYNVVIPFFYSFQYPAVTVRCRWPSFFMGCGIPET